MNQKNNFFRLFFIKNGNFFSYFNSNLKGSDSEEKKNSFSYNDFVFKIKIITKNQHLEKDGELVSK